MDKTKKQLIKCEHCGTWFPNYGIVFEDMESFDTATLSNNKIKCTVCEKMTGCNKENMKIVSEKGGHIGNDTF